MDTLLHSYCLATAESYEEAERLLAANPDVAQSAAGLDVLARIRMEQGDEATARRLWRAVLEREPGHPGATAALGLLDNPWRAGFSVNEPCGRLRRPACWQWP